MFWCNRRGDERCLYFEEAFVSEESANAIEDKCTTFEIGFDFEEA